MTKKNKEILNNRIKSFAWRGAGMAVVAILSFVLENEALLELPNYAVVIIGLAVGEITKYINCNK